MEDGKQPQTVESLLVALRDEIQRQQTPLDIQSLEQICFQQKIQGHLAIFTQPYLEKIIARHKTIESRFSKPRSVPFQRVQKGDVLFLKQTAGPLVAIAFVSEVRFFGPLEVGESEEIMEEYDEELALEESFREAKRDSKYGTLVFLGSVITTQPLPVAKSDRRAWIVLNNGPKQVSLF